MIANDVVAIKARMEEIQAERWRNIQGAAIEPEPIEEPKSGGWPTMEELKAWTRGNKSIDYTHYMDSGHATGG